MNFRKTYHLIIISIIGILIHSCVEPFDDFNTEIFESALVIEATITNELKPQEISLSRTFALEEDGPSPEADAIVKVVDDTQQEYRFQEIDAGRYVSTTAFKAETNRVYKLSITTSNGRSYNSEPTQPFTNTSSIDNLYLQREFNKDSIEGVSILVDSFDPTGGSNYYRYTYEETYKIISPKYSPFDVVFREGSFTEFDLLPRIEQEKICYNTVASNTVIITNTDDLEENRVSRFTVRFLNRDNYIISHRYSILVRQYIQSREAFVYYKTLKQFSQSESLFSENQPGFFSGNIHSEESRNEKVIGFFEISSVDSKRIYFNYEDLFPDEDLPPFVVGCNTFIAPEEKDIGCGYPLYDHIAAGFQYFFENTDGKYGFGPFNLVPEACGDCTALGKTEIPDFWIE